MEKELIIIIGIISSLMFLVSIILIILATKRVAKTESAIKSLKSDLERTRNTVLSAETSFGTVDQTEYMKNISDRLEDLEKKQDNYVDRVDIVRYFASDVDEGRASYSIGITNAKKDGAVLTALMYRNGMNLYVKKLEEGVSDYPLSDEEKEAVSRSKITKVIG